MSTPTVQTDSVRGNKLPQYLVVYIGACAGFLQLFDIAIQRTGLEDRYFTVALLACIGALPVVVGAALLSELKGKERAVHGGAARRRLAGATALLLFVLVAAVAAPRAAAHLTPETRPDGEAAVLLTGLVSRTGDSAIAAVASDALRLDFEDDAALAVIPPEHAAQVLALDGVILRVPIPAAYARRAAAQIGAAGYVTGDIARAGTNYLLMAELYNTDGQRVAGTRVSTTDEGGLWRALDELSAKLRAAARGLPLATAGTTPALTSSAEAITSYAQAVQAVRSGARAEAELRVRRALQHDSAFVPALRLLGELLYERGDSTAGRPLLVTAHERAASLQGRERYLAFAAYYDHVEQKPATAVVNYRRILQLDPADSLARARIARLKAQ